MRKADLRHNHKTFEAALTRYRAFAEKVIQAKRVIGTTAEKRDLAESTLLRVCAQWERFVDEHIVDCVNRDHSKLREYFSVAIPPNPSWDLCHALIIGAKYLDFRSIGELAGFTAKILPDASNPFKKIGKAEHRMIDETFKMRNYLSHYSQASRRALEKVYGKQYGMKRFIEPGAFLLADQGSRLLTYIDAFQRASTAMRT
jgi:hypothetical protein